MKPDPTASRWARLAVIKKATPLDHEWARLYDSLVIVPVIQAPQDRPRWRVFDADGILERLESSAIEHGLMEADDPPMLDFALALAQIIRSSTGVKELR